VVCEKAETLPFQQEPVMADCAEGSQQLPVRGEVLGACP
jgi:hypothetical protein